MNTCGFKDNKINKNTISPIQSNVSYVKLNELFFKIKVEEQKLLQLKRNTQKTLRNEIKIEYLEEDALQYLKVIKDYVHDIIYDIYNVYTKNNILFTSDQKLLIMKNVKIAINEYISKLVFNVYTSSLCDCCFHSMKVYLEPIRHIEILIDTQYVILESDKQKKLSATIPMYDSAMASVQPSIIKGRGVQNEEFNNISYASLEPPQYRNITSTYYMDYDSRSVFRDSNKDDLDVNVSVDDKKPDILSSGLFKRGDAFSNVVLTIPPSVWRTNLDIGLLLYLSYRGYVKIYNEM